jgi:prepilin-type N-terminal cleavage/methylation domain-containing protein
MNDRAFQPHCASRRVSAGGFTLLELLVATAVSAIVLLVINTTFFSALRLHNTTHDNIDRDLELQRALGIIRKDLAGLTLPGNATSTNYTLKGQFSTDPATELEAPPAAGERVSPDIYTTSATIDGWTSFSEVQMVNYFLTPANDGTTNKNLVRVAARNLLPVQDLVGEEQTLLTGLTSAEMTFFDGTDWTDTWDSSTTSTLPTALKFSIVLAPRDNTGLARPTAGPIDLIVPVLVSTRTTAQQVAAAAAATP